MKTFEKILIAVGTLALGYILYKKGKKELEGLEKQEQASNDELINLGVNPEKLRKEIMPEDDKKLVKSLYVATAFNSEFDMDIINPAKSIRSYNVVHVRESSDTKGKRQFLDILIEIPDYTGEKSNFAPRIADYMRCLKEGSDYIWSRLVVFANDPRPKLEGYLLISYVYNEKEYFELLKIPESVYGIFKDGKHDGLSKFFEEFINKRVTPEMKNAVHKWIYEDEGFDEGTDVAPRDIYLMYRISYPIRTGDHLTGIDLPRALRTLKYLATKFEVTRVEGKDPVYYDHLLFHHSENMLDYYTVNKKGEIVVKDIKFTESDDDE